jgi:pantoate--beta-alanine ligase
MVPTMGFLHEGHLSLLREARRRVPDGELVLTIFVNPTQFGPNEDLDVYPRDEARDLDKAKASGVDLAFCPIDAEEMFPSDANTWVYVDSLQDVLCGASRPDHFRGVCTVCAKLWNLIRPDVSVFGRKDYQQLTILRRMHRDLHLSGEIVGGEIVREPDGIAMSSRNTTLSPDAREAALAIPRFLDEVHARFESGQRNVAALIGDAPERLAPGKIDYVEIREATDLGALEVIEQPAVCALAVTFGGVRLIDNRVLEPA